MPLLVGHVEHPHRPGADHAAGEGRLADHHQNVERITIVGQAALDEPVVAWVVDAAEEHPVEHEPMPNMVVLVFHPTPARDLHDDLDRPSLGVHHAD